jgi:hypothetical protein
VSGNINRSTRDLKVVPLDPAFTRRAVLSLASQRDRGMTAEAVLELMEILGLSEALEREQTRRRRRAEYGCRDG